MTQRSRLPLLLPLLSACGALRLPPTGTARSPAAAVSSAVAVAPLSAGGSPAPAAATQCKADEWEVTPLEKGKDRVCRKKTICVLNQKPHEAGKYTLVRSTKTADRKCADLRVCDYDKEYEFTTRWTFPLSWAGS